MQIWEQFLQEQETELGVETVQKWLRSLKVLRYDACNLYLEAKDSFQALWFEEHIKGKAQLKLLNGNHKKIKIHLSIADTLTGIQKRGRSNRKNSKVANTATFQLSFDELDPYCLFQYFVPGKENPLSLKIIYDIAHLSKEPTTLLGGFNPIYLYGSSGTGKTHLLMSLTQSFRAQGYKAIYVRAEQFTDHVVTAIRAGEMSSFRQAYRNADILLVDDVHVFSRKGATQEEFFHTFNTLHLQGKQIILSANCAPQELHLIEPRLVSRFEWGIELPMKPLSTKEELSQILEAKARAFQFFLPSKITNFLIETFNRNPKILVKAFEALILRLNHDSHQKLENLTIAAVKTLLADLFLEEERSALTFPKIIQIVADYYGIQPDDILGKSQTRECALPRQLAMHLCREKLKMPFMKIGELFFRDHSTVMASVRFIQKSLDEDHRVIAGAWNAIANKLYA